jgi:N-acetylglutamate synthase-like GNAT family acetyltransferase
VDGLNNASFKIRRATLEDLPALGSLWALMKYDVEALSRRITEFQVAEHPHGMVVGALGLEIAERQGRIHSEAFTDFSLAEPLRPMLWERLNNLAHNHGLLRLWTTEQAPFWRRSGLAPAGEELLPSLPAVWRQTSGQWLTLKLKEDVDALLAMDHELALMLETERQRSRKALEQARVLKSIAIAFGILLVLFIVGASVWVMLRRGSLHLPGH